MVAIGLRHGSDQTVVGSDRTDCESTWQRPDRNSDTRLNIALKGKFAKRCYLYRRCCSSLQDRHFTEKFLQLVVFEELHCWNMLAVHANNQSHVTVVRYIISKKPEKWKPNKYFSLDAWVSFYLYFMLLSKCNLSKNQ